MIFRAKRFLMALAAAGTLALAPATVGSVRADDDDGRRRGRYGYRGPRGIPGDGWRNRGRGWRGRHWRGGRRGYYRPRSGFYARPRIYRPYAVRPYYYGVPYGYGAPYGGYYDGYGWGLSTPSFGIQVW